MMPISANEKFLTERDLEQRGIAKAQTLAKWRMLGQGPRYYRCGGAIRYRLSDVEAWLNEGAVNPLRPMTA
jgi:hypothetical protein